MHGSDICTETENFLCKPAHLRIFLFCTVEIDSLLLLLFVIKADGITFYGSRFAFEDSTIGYIGKDVSEMFNRIFQIIGIISSQI